MTLAAAALMMRVTIGPALCLLCRLDGHRIMDRAPPTVATARPLIVCRSAWFRADAADPAWQPAGSHDVKFATSVWVTGFSVELVLYATAPCSLIFILVSERAVIAHKNAASTDPWPACSIAAVRGASSR